MSDGGGSLQASMTPGEWKREIGVLCMLHLAAC
jgi:hypothetical protein